MEEEILKTQPTTKSTMRNGWRADLSEILRNFTFWEMLWVDIQRVGARYSQTSRHYYIYNHVRMYLCTCMYVYTMIYNYVRMYMCICMYVYTMIFNESEQDILNRHVTTTFTTMFVCICVLCMYVYTEVQIHLYICMHVSNRRYWKSSNTDDIYIYMYIYIYI